MKEKNMSYFKIENLSLTLQNKKCLFSDVNLSLEKGKVGAILGQSGSGKTSLLRCIAGLETATAGKISFFENKEVIDVTTLPPFQRKIGLMFQSTALFPHLTVKENILFGIQNFSEEQKKFRLEQMVDLIRMGDYLNKYPDKLSGGEKQRIALARSLAPSPILLLMDEPFTGLDFELKNKMKSDLLNIFRQDGTTALFVTHDHNEAFFLADNVGKLNAGQLTSWTDKKSAFRVDYEETPKLI